MKKLLWVGDAACPSGFARATHEILDTLRYTLNVTVLGMNYRGDPHHYPYPIYAAAPGGDPFGMGRLIWMCDSVSPDIIVLQNDGWNIPFYTKQLASVDAYKNIPIVAAVAVDGKNFNGKWLDGVSLAVFWTQFALDEARLGGYKGPAVVIPLGVDIEAYHPMSKAEACAARNVSALNDYFIVGTVNRNQPRKRWDLTIKYFAEWVKSHSYKDAILFLHAAPTGDLSVNPWGMADYYGVGDQIAVSTPDAFYGIPEADMCATYNCFDVYISTTQGEGMGLPAMEAMACGVPCILPDWSAYGDWAKGAAMLVPCTSTAIGPPYQDVIGGVADEKLFIDSLEAMRLNALLRREMGRMGRERVSEDRFRWSNIGDAWLKALDEVLYPMKAPTIAIVSDVSRMCEKVTFP